MKASAKLEAMSPEERYTFMLGRLEKLLSSVDWAPGLATWEQTYEITASARFGFDRALRAWCEDMTNERLTAELTLAQYWLVQATLSAQNAFARAQRQGVA